MSMSISSSSLDPKVAGAAIASSAATSSSSASESTSASGLSSAGSSMSSAAAPAESRGFSAAVSAWVSYIIDGIRGCLAKLPLIGRFFASADASSSSTDGASSASGASSCVTDAQLLQMVQNTFVQDASAVVPTDESVGYCLAAINNMSRPLEQMQAYLTVLMAANSSDPIAQRFFAALPKGVQNEYRGEIWKFNKGDDLSSSGMSNNKLPVGEVVTSGVLIRCPLAKQAAQNYITVLEAGAAAAAAAAASATAASSSATASTSSASSSTSTTV